MRVEEVYCHPIFVQLSIPLFLVHFSSNAHCGSSPSTSFTVDRAFHLLTTVDETTPTFPTVVCPRPSACFRACGPSPASPGCCRRWSHSRRSRPKNRSQPLPRLRQSGGRIACCTKRRMQSLNGRRGPHRLSRSGPHPLCHCPPASCVKRPGYGCVLVEGPRVGAAPHPSPGLPVRTKIAFLTGTVCCPSAGGQPAACVPLILWTEEVCRLANVS